jgi:hypothetical protein
VNVGFTGTKDGITEGQVKALRQLILQLLEKNTTLVGHHGDCVGADASFHTICSNLGLPVVIHPPSDPKHRAFCKPSRDVRAPKPYLERNHDIVDETDVLIACPSSLREELRSGTWATVRYARKQSKPLWIIYRSTPQP